MNQKAVDRSEQLFGYCAHCDEVLGFAAREYLGRSVQCPTNKEHHAAVVKGDIGKSWLRFEKCLMWWQLSASPFRWLNNGIFRRRAGVYVFFQFLLIILGLYLINPQSFDSISLIVILISSFFLIDIIISNTSIVFITRFPARPLRSVILTMFVFLNIVAIFAIYYKFWSIYIPQVEQLSAVQSFYFSLVTVTTLGYGDLSPLLDRPPMLLLICFELVVGIYFLALIITIIASWSMSSPTRLSPLNVPDLEPLEDDCSDDGRGGSNLAGDE